MNKEILNNLYEFWSYVGKKTRRLVENNHYKSVSVIDSDWPNRVFSISDGKNILSEIIDLIRGKLLPNIIAVPKPNSLENRSYSKLFLTQRNMALSLKTEGMSLKDDVNIKQVRTKEDAFNFAKTASDAFEYKVDGNIIYLLSEDSSKVRLYNYLQNNEYLGCGIIFIDSNNNAGLHMIGTISNGRGKGIGTKMTKKLLLDARANKSEFCVLHASMMGENIYKKLGFNSFGKLETYLILDK
jgi:ribosomal protein S18 acetylase RimI-like enzyme